VILIPGNEPGDRYSGWLSLPPLILVTFSPIIFLSGLVEMFKSSFWTLSYREFRPLSGDAS
jgi:hypothetical protein